ncbi:hypothetical protein B0H14DRAFT_2603538 [Mycena olivaceomarginata]|nr:hypothetical protein B0H14DRAFT_2603538 [Mycena olivaceomarginata]
MGKILSARRKFHIQGEATDRIEKDVIVSSNDAKMGGSGRVQFKILRKGTAQDLKRGSTDPHKLWREGRVILPNHLLLPGYNESLSLFPPGFWDRTPHHTNLGEAREFDDQRAASIRTTREICILPNHNNNDKNRMRRAVGRQAHQYKRHEEHSALETGLAVTCFADHHGSGSAAGVVYERSTAGLCRDPAGKPRKRPAFKPPGCGARSVAAPVKELHKGQSAEELAEPHRLVF